MTEFTALTSADAAASSLSENIRGRNVLITGATLGGLGAEAARAIALCGPALLVLAGRSAVILEETRTQVLAASPSVNIRLLVCDFASIKSVRAAAAVVDSYSETIDVLINNVASTGAFSATADGFDRLFQVNYLSTFLFTTLLKSSLAASPGSRVVLVSSAAHHVSDIDLSTFGVMDESRYDQWKAYAMSKTALILFGQELARRWALDGITVVSLHPGTIKTNFVTENTAKELTAAGFGHIVSEDGTLGTNQYWKTLSQGAATHIVAAFDASLVDHSGSYLVDCQVANDQLATHASASTSADKASELWNLTEKILEKCEA